MSVFQNLWMDTAGGSRQRCTTRLMNAQTLPIQKLNYSMTEAAYVVGCSAQTLRRLIRRDELRTVRVGKRRLVPLAELERLCGTNTQPERAA